MISIAKRRIIGAVFASVDLFIDEFREILGARLGGGLDGDRVFSFGPFAEIDEFAAIGTERPVRIFRSE